MGTERVQEAQFMKTPKCWESVWYASGQESANKVDDIFYSVRVTEKKNYINIMMPPYMPLCRCYNGGKVQLVQVNSSKRLN